MKTIKIILLISFLFSSQGALAWGNYFGKYDKHMHVAVSAAGTIVGYKVCQKYTSWSDTACRVTSGVVTFAITGPGKEYSDQNFDYKDMYASGAGTILGLGITFAF